MRALVVGLGSIGRRHARNWAALGLGEVWVCRLVGAPQPEPLGVDTRLFSDLDAALAAGPDVVLVTNPTSLHVATALAAIRAGCHAFVEKPLGCTLDGLAELLDEARRRERKVVVGYNLRFHPGLARLRALLLGGEIGRPLSARCEMGEYLPGWHPWEDYRRGYSARRDLGGGPVLTFSHEIDSLWWLLGPPRHISALARRVSSLEIDTEDVAEIGLELETGALGSIHVDFFRRPARRQVEVVGSEGVLRWDYDANRVWVYSEGSGQWRVEEGSPSFERNGMFRDELRQVAAYCSGGDLGALADGVQGAGVTAVALAALRASREGRTLDLTRDLPAAARAWLGGPSPSPTLL